MNSSASASAICSAEARSSDIHAVEPTWSREAPRKAAMFVNQNNALIASCSATLVRIRGFRGYLHIANAQFRPGEFFDLYIVFEWRCEAIVFVVVETRRFVLVTASCPRPSNALRLTLIAASPDPCHSSTSRVSSPQVLLRTLASPGKN